MEEEPPGRHPFFEEVRVRYARLAEEVLRPRRLGGLRRWLAQGPAEVARWGPLPEVALCVEDAPPPSAGAAGGAGGAALDEQENRATGAWDAGGAGAWDAGGAGAWDAGGAGAWDAAGGAGAWDAAGGAGAWDWDAAGGAGARGAGGAVGTAGGAVGTAGGAVGTAGGAVARGAGGGAAGTGGATLDELENRATATGIALTAWQGLLRGIGLAGGGGRPPAAALAREMLRHPWLARRARGLSQAAREALARMPGGFALAGRTPKLLPGYEFNKHYYICAELPKLLAIAGAVAANGDLRDARQVLVYLDGNGALRWMGPGDFADGARNPRRAVFDFFAGAALDALDAKGDPGRFRAAFSAAERRGARAPQAWLEAAEALGGPRVGAVRALLAGRGALFARWGPPSGAA